MISNSKERILRLVNRIMTVCKEYGKKHNVNKAKTLVIRKKLNANVEISITGSILERRKKLLILDAYSAKVEK